MRASLFIELCCGSAAVTLRLLGGQRCTPPVGYMGAKTSLAGLILHTLGLRSGQGADAVLLCDAGPWGRVWTAVADPGLRGDMLAHLRSWADEDPRDLWDRLRAAPVPSDEAAFVAHWLWLQARTCNQVPVWIDRNGWAMCEKNTSARRHITQTHSRESGKSPVQRGYRPDLAGYDGIQRPATVCRRIEVAAAALSRTELEIHCRDVRYVPVPETVERDVVVYIDPPYQGRTGYGADLPREDAIAMAERWARVGARVAVSEAVPLDIPGWHHVRLPTPVHGRAKSRGEWLTLSLPPAIELPQQQPLFREAGVIAP